MVESEERDRFADWILRNTVNDYTPYGTSNHGARSLDELHQKDGQYFFDSPTPYDPQALVRSRILGLLEYISRLQVR